MSQPPSSALPPVAPVAHHEPGPAGRDELITALAWAMMADPEVADALKVCGLDCILPLTTAHLAAEAAANVLLTGPHT